MLKRILRAFWVNSPKTNLRCLATTFENRAFHSTKPEQNYLLDHPVNHPKHRQWDRFFFHFYRNEHALRMSFGDEFSFKDRDILEIGAGPVLGYAPFAILEGCSTYTIIDIACKDLRDDPYFTNRYLRGIYLPLTSLKATNIDYEHFLHKIKEVNLYTRPIEELDLPDESYDLVVSNSCLEHIETFESTVDKLHAVSRASTYNIHLIDFSSHTSEGDSPFVGKYKIPRFENRSHIQLGGSLNLMTPSEMIRIFDRYFKKVVFLPLVDLNGFIDIGDVHPEWKSYDTKELLTLNGVLIAQK